MKEHRVANRIADGKFKLDGKEYQLAQVIIIIIASQERSQYDLFLKTMLSDILQNNGPNALHGGLVGLDKVV